MAGDPPRRNPKVGVHRGGGPPPGYRWTLLILDPAYDEARKFLDYEQYEHLARQFRELAREADPTHSSACDVEPVEDFYELRDKGGVLGKSTNVRVFFHVEKSNRSIVVLHAIFKKNDGPTPRSAKINARSRKRAYLESLRGRP